MPDQTSESFRKAEGVRAGRSATQEQAASILEALLDAFSGAVGIPGPDTRAAKTGELISGAADLIPGAIAIPLARQLSRYFRRGYGRFINSGPVPAPISADPYGLQEGALDRRAALWRMVGGPQRAAEQRVQISPGIFGKAAEALEMTPRQAIPARRRIMDEIRKEGGLLGQLHDKYGVLNKNLEGGGHLDVEDALTFTHPISGLEATNTAGTVRKLTDNLSYGTVQRNAPTINTIERAAPRVKITEVQSELSKKLQTQIDELRDANYKLSRQADTYYREMKEGKNSRPKFKATHDKMMQIRARVDELEVRRDAELRRTREAVPIHDDPQKYLKDAMDLYSRQQAPFDINYLHSSRRRNPESKFTVAMREKFGDREFSRREVVKLYRETHPGGNPKHASLGVYNRLEGRTNTLESGLTSRYNPITQSHEYRFFEDPSDHVARSTWINQPRREQYAQDLREKAARIGGPFGKIARELVEAKIAGREISEKVQDSMVRASMNAITSRFGLDLDRAANVTSAVKRVADTIPKPEKLVEKEVKSITDALYRRFGIRRTSTKPGK